MFQTTNLFQKQRLLVMNQFLAKGAGFIGRTRRAAADLDVAAVWPRDALREMGHGNHGRCVLGGVFNRLKWVFMRI